MPDRGDHRLADGASRRYRAPIEPRLGGKRTNGVKRHVAVDENGLLLAIVVTAASIQDRDAAHRLLTALRGSSAVIPDV
ncbi:transposase [Rhodococcus sp. USK13]|uniref:transposase n=1 Tax=Rhodococcus sp. USK13 TaxID=2806442 RepID=UPI0020172952|nr:transposase [Rhodococcus sp. USK13]